MKDFLIALRLAAISVLVCAVAYPLTLAAFASAAFPFTASGSILHDDAGNPIGSERIAQEFASAGYFWPRPSAVDYNAAATGGSNLSPTNPKIAERAIPILVRLGASEQKPVPLDLVTASGSGVDPDITEAAALFQVPRIASARNLTETDLHALIKRSSRLPGGFMAGGGRIVNVLNLNIELDRLAAGK